MRYVKTDYEWCPYITAGKVYKLINPDDENFCCIIDDERDALFGLSLHQPCAYLGCEGTWIECDVEGNDIGGGDEQCSISNTFEQSA